MISPSLIKFFEKFFICFPPLQLFCKLLSGVRPPPFFENIHNNQTHNFIFDTKNNKTKNKTKPKKTKKKKQKNKKKTKKQKNKKKQKKTNF